MDLHLDTKYAARYKSPSQRARVVTEAWASRELYCISCPQPKLIQERAGTKVTDYHCKACGTHYQLKAKSGPFGRKVSNSAYEPKMEAIRAKRAPTYAFLSYDAVRWNVMDLFMVPGYLLSPGTIEKRPPLSPHARRHGWVGSNIILGLLPSDARVTVISSGVPRNPIDARRDWKRFAFVREDKRAAGGWTADVLRCVRTFQRETGASEFTLRAFEARFLDELQCLYPDNHNVVPKIRQQMQVLRDGGVVRFLGKGRYGVIG